MKTFHGWQQKYLQYTKIYSDQSRRQKVSLGKFRRVSPVGNYIPGQKFFIIPTPNVATPGLLMRDWNIDNIHIITLEGKA